ncbi:30S ribosomal protein S2 [Candidatus Microgenomates bacterium]|nr:30S ribosomal protein S2 [Candidatus Microgenomates bacterium]
MRDISLKELLEAGCHFGHQVTRQNPKAREFIFQAREGIHVIDLAKTKAGLEAAAAFVKTLASQDGAIIFVGTKRQAKNMVEEAAKKCGAFIVTERWIGGTLTNFEEVAKNYAKLKDLRARLQSEEEKAKYTKKEVGLWNKERIKLEKLYGGVADMDKLPDVVFVVDTHKEELTVKEANRRGIPVVGIVDTNADPTIIDYPIPANDDAVGSLKLIIDYMAEAWMEGSKLKVTLRQAQGDAEQSRSIKSEKLKVEGETKEIKEDPTSPLRLPFDNAQGRRSRLRGARKNAKEKSKSKKPKATKTSKKNATTENTEKKSEGTDSKSVKSVVVKSVVASKTKRGSK